MGRREAVQRFIGQRSAIAAITQDASRATLGALRHVRMGGVANVATMPEQTSVHFPSLVTAVEAREADEFAVSHLRSTIKAPNYTSECA
ncbi:hypothetical protein RN69_22860 [Bradyrhizobium japonicum]|nr:hypothetical protein RN69_22860 [Bradyrhizobium japonicum]